ncbi:MAG: PIG-L deacetylase family protein [Candidatus Hodarchaeota archaeon]
MQFARLTPGSKILFFVPHSDDLEFGPANICVEALRLGCDVTEVVATNSAFGTKKPEFKGERLYRIRKRELARTLEVYEKHTGNELKLLRLEYIDGSLPLEKESIERIRNVMEEKSPDLIFAPDPVYAQDYHEDHLNTGRLVWFALKSMEREQRPKHLFLYYTFKPNFGIACDLSNVKVLKDAFYQHRSQVPPFKVGVYTTFKKVSLLVKYPRAKAFIDTVRHVPLKTTYCLDKHDNITSFKDRAIYSLFYKWMPPFPPEFYQLNGKKIEGKFED